MSAIAPPAYIVQPIHRAAPTLWPNFLGLANSALQGADVRVTSWWRSPDRNARVGGARQSQHLLGLAFDVVGPLDQVALVKQRLQRFGFVVVDEADHMHVQAFPAGVLAPTGVFGLVR